MYEQDEPVLRRALLIVLWFIIIFTIVWAVVWLIFFRHNSPSKVATTNKPHTSQSQSTSGSNKQEKEHSGSSTSSTSGSSSKKTTAPAPAPVASSTSNSSSSTTTAQQPTNLANTGAGNVFIPFGVASVSGTVFYYVRLRKKVAR